MDTKQLCVCNSRLLTLLKKYASVLVGGHGSRSLLAGIFSIRISQISLQRCLLAFLCVLASSFCYVLAISPWYPGLLQFCIIQLLLCHQVCMLKCMQVCLILQFRSSCIPLLCFACYTVQCHVRKSSQNEVVFHYG